MKTGTSVKVETHKTLLKPLLISDPKWGSILGGANSPSQYFTGNSGIKASASADFSDLDSGGISVDFAGLNFFHHMANQILGNPHMPA
jgi:hypothetical protein